MVLILHYKYFVTLHFFLWTLYGEDRISCNERKENQIFGWYPCFEASWNTFVNTYEITLVVEFIALSGLMYYVFFALFKDFNKNIVVFLLNTVNLIFGIILLLGSPSFLDNFTDVFNWTGFVCSLVIFILVEIYVRMPYFGYVQA